MMKLAVAVILATLSEVHIANGFYVKSESYKPFIIGGHNAIRGALPYMVSIQTENEHQCGGAIISPRWIVSAAHCFYKDHGYYAVAGLINLKESQPSVQRVLAVKVVKHPDITRNLNDIALIQLAQPFVFNEYVLPITLPKPNEEFNGKVTVSGWGRSSEIPIAYPDILQYLELSLITIKECNALNEKLDSYRCKVTEAHVCALPDKPKQSGCYGDSGGPLAQIEDDKNVLVGIVLGGSPNCGSKLEFPAPNIYTKISYHIDFIMKHVDDLP